MTSQPNGSSRNTIRFPTHPRPRRTNPPFHTRSDEATAQPAPETTTDPEATPEESRPATLRDALDRLADPDDTSLAEGTGFDDSDNREASAPGNRDSLESRIASRLRESGEAGESTQEAPAASVPEAPGAEQDPKVAYDAELIEILEQLNTTLDTAQTVLDDGHATPAGIAQPMAESPLTESPKRPGRPVFFAAAAIGLAAAAGLIYAYPWAADSPSSAGAPSDASTTREAPESPSLATRGADEAVTPAPKKSLDRPSTAANPSVANALTPDTLNVAPLQRRKAQNTFGVETANGTAGAPIPIRLSLPATAGGPETSILIQGVPEGASLSAGSNVRKGTWVLEPGAIDGLTLSLSDDTFVGRFTLDVTLVTSNGGLPEARSLEVVVGPVDTPAPTPQSAAAPPASEPAAPATTAGKPAGTAPSATAPRISPEEETRLVERGTALMSDGDIAGARLIFEHAAERGSVRAMAAMAQTYDPEHLSKLQVQGIRPDPDKALSWYERASRGGDQRSRVRAEALLPQARR